LAYPDEAFDAVVIVFGVFFFPDVEAITARLWRWVRPGGRLAVTTWGPRLFEPANSIFWGAVGAVRPELDRAYRPWDSLTEPDAVRSLLTGAGTVAPDVEAEAGTHPLTTAEDFWAIVLGTGYRATHDQLSDAERPIVRDRVLTALAERHVTSIETNVIYAVATKPA
jgi:SAM-dependent methyltransferase